MQNGNNSLNDTVEIPDLLDDSSSDDNFSDDLIAAALIAQGYVTRFGANRPMAVIVEDTVKLLKLLKAGLEDNNG